MTTATTLRDEGMHAAEAAADSRVIFSIDVAIEAAIKARQPFSANDIRDLMPTTRSKGLVGARVNSYAARRPPVMVKVDEEPSNLPSTHHKNIAVWCGVRDAAVRS